jgi:hypothetical protein
METTKTKQINMESVNDKVFYQVGEEVRQELDEQLITHVDKLLYGQVNDKVFYQVGEEVHNHVWLQITNKVWEQLKQNRLIWE